MLAQYFLAPFFPELIFRKEAVEKVLYLTFDDGPTEITPWILDELKKYEARATFFCVGNNIKKNPALFTEIISQEQRIGNHTMSHSNGWKTKTKNYLDDVEECDFLLRDVQSKNLNVKFKNDLFRPPYGRITPSQYFSLRKNYKIVMWDVLSKDYDQGISADKCLNRVITKSKPGSIIVFHDSLKAEKNLKYALPRVLEYFSKRKYSFSSLTN